MIRINLLPPEILVEMARKRAKRRVLASGAVVLALIFGLYGFFLFATMNVKARALALAEERAKVEGEVARYQHYVKLQAEVQGRSALVKQAMGAQLAWREVLRAVGTEIPPNVWLTDFTLAYRPGDGEGQLTMRGLTYDHPSTARWLAVLPGLPGVSGARAVFSAEEKVEEQELVRFELKANISPGDELDQLGGRK